MTVNWKIGELDETGKIPKDDIICPTCEKEFKSLEKHYMKCRGHRK